MFEIGWSEMLVIAIVLIVVVGPKDLPAMLRTFGRTVAKLRGMAGDFQKQFNDALKEAELDDVKKSVDALRGLNPVSEIRKQLNPFEQAASDVRSGLDNVMKPKAAEESAATAAAEPAVEPPFPAMTDSSVAATPAAQPMENPVPTKAGERSTKMADATVSKPMATKPAVKPKASATSKATVAKATAAKPVSTKASPTKAVATKDAPVPGAKIGAGKAAPVKAVAVKAVSAKAAPAKAAAHSPSAAAKPAATKKKTAGPAK